MECSLYSYMNAYVVPYGPQRRDPRLVPVSNLPTARQQARSMNREPFTSR